MTKHTEAETAEWEELNFEETASDIAESIDELNALTAELTETMGEVADGFESFSQSTAGLGNETDTRIDTSTGGGVTQTVAND